MPAGGPGEGEGEGEGEEKGEGEGEGEEEGEGEGEGEGDGSRPLTVERTADGDVHVLTLARPDTYNALNRELLAALADALRAARGETAAVVLRGDGGAFSSGIDLEEATLRDDGGGAGSNRRDGGDDDGGHPALLLTLQDASRALFAYDGLAVAALDGHVVGAGLELACGCDVRMSAPDASFRLPELELGITLTNGATRTLPELVGRGTATRLALDGGPFDGREMAEAGLVDTLDDDPEERARELAVRAAELPRESLVRTLKAFAADRSLEATLDAEIRDVLAVQSGTGSGSSGRR